MYVSRHFRIAAESSVKEKNNNNIVIQYNYNIQIDLAQVDLSFVWLMSN